MAGWDMGTSEQFTNYWRRRSTTDVALSPHHHPPPLRQLPMPENATARFVQVGHAAVRDHAALGPWAWALALAWSPACVPVPGWARRCS